MVIEKLCMITNSDIEERKPAQTTCHMSHLSDGRARRLPMGRDNMKFGLVPHVSYSLYRTYNCNNIDQPTFRRSSYVHNQETVIQTSNQ